MIELLKPLKDQARAAVRRATGEDPRAGTVAVFPSSPSSEMAELGRPLRDSTPEREACEALFVMGRDLARQDRWDSLSAEIAMRDASRAVTVGGTPEAEILAAGARSDLSRALYGASEAGALAPRNEMLTGLAALDAEARDRRGDTSCAAIVALTHMDAGWAWYKQGWQRGRPEQHIAQFRLAFDRARDLLRPYRSEMDTSPLLASVRCALLAGHQEAERHVVDDYETLIALAPGMPGHMRAFGLHLLPCWFGSHDLLEIQARRIAAITQAQWGAGGYAWVYLDALLQDEGCFERLDGDFFLDAVDNILGRRPGQHTVNLMTACLTQMLAPRAVGGPDRAMRRALTDRRDRLIRDEMTETHAWVWSFVDTGYATPGTHHLARPADAESGIAPAWDAVSSVLSRDLRRGAVRA